MTKNTSSHQGLGEGWVGPLPEILTVDEVAQYLRESRAVIKRMIRETEKTGDWARSFLRGNSYKIPREDVEDYVHKHYGTK